MLTGGGGSRSAGLQACKGPPGSAKGRYMTAFRTERDPLGELKVPADAYYGVQTARAVENFPISGLRAPADLVTATILVKKTAAYKLLPDPASAFTRPFIAPTPLQLNPSYLAILRADVSPYTDVQFPPAHK